MVRRGISQKAGDRVSDDSCLGPRLGLLSREGPQGETWVTRVGDRLDVLPSHKESPLSCKRSSKDLSLCSSPGDESIC